MASLIRQRAARVLVIDDDRLTARLLEYVLQKHHYKVSRVGNGEDGLEAARQFAPDAILLDLQLPAMSGLEVLQALRADSAFGHPAVIVLTANSFATVPQTVLAAGADAHCTKPIAPSSLLQLLHSLRVPPSVPMAEPVSEVCDV